VSFRLNQVRTLVYHVVALSKYVCPAASTHNLTMKLFITSLECYSISQDQQLGQLSAVVRLSLYARNIIDGGIDASRRKEWGYTVDRKMVVSGDSAIHCTTCTYTNMPSALLLGATGQVGQNVLKELLASSYFTRVGEYGRRVTNLDTITSGKEKLEQKTVDFEKIDQAGLKDGKWDVFFITFVALARDVTVI
jgi:hypothetical protein